MARRRIPRSGEPVAILELFVDPDRRRSSSKHRRSRNSRGNSISTIGSAFMLAEQHQRAGCRRTRKNRKIYAVGTTVAPKGSVRPRRKRIPAFVRRVVIDPGFHRYSSAQQGLQCLRLVSDEREEVQETRYATSPSGYLGERRATQAFRCFAVNSR